MGNEEQPLDQGLNLKSRVASSSEDAECDRRRLQQQVMMFQPPPPPPQDFDPRDCRHSLLRDEEEMEKRKMLFNTRRRTLAFGRAHVHPLQPKTIDEDVICQQVAVISWQTMQLNPSSFKTTVVSFRDNSKNNN